jgi:hypothetical protein
MGARLALQEELRAQRGERTEMLWPEYRFREAARSARGGLTRRRTPTATAFTSGSCPNAASCDCRSATSPRSTHTLPRPGGVGPTHVEGAQERQQARPVLSGDHVQP